MNQVRKILPLLEVTAMVIVILLGLSMLADYGMADYKQRTVERHFFIDKVHDCEAYPSEYVPDHIPVSESCTTDTECEYPEPLMDIPANATTK